MDADPSPLRRVLASSWPALLAFGLLAWHFRFTCDDAYITFRYARHLAEGVGLRFNPGESPPVEGYSNLLWTVLLTLPERLGWAVASFASLASAACGAALVLVVAWYCAARLRLCVAGVGATALFFGTLPAVGVWATSGLETMPFCLAVFATFAGLTSRAEAASKRGLLVAAAAGGAAVLLRADGFGFVALALAAAFVAGARPRALAAVAVPVALVLALQFLWRHSYYGEWLPNTARVKAGLSAARIERGWGYLASQLLAMPALAVVVLLGAGRVVRNRTRTGSGAVGAAALGMVLANGAYAVFVGGDFMAMGRFLAPSMAFAAVLFAVVSTPWALPWRLGFAAVLMTSNALAAVDLHGVPGRWRQAVHFRWNTDRARSEVEQWASMKANGEELALLGRALRDQVAPGESMIRSSVGGVGYYTELWLHDRNGLVSPSVVDGSEPLERASPGHDRRVEPEFFFDRRPTYYGAKLVGGDFGRGGLGPDAQALAAAGKLVVRRTPLGRDLIEAEGLPQGIELQLLELRWPEGPERSGPEPRRP